MKTEDGCGSGFVLICSDDDFADPNQLVDDIKNYLIDLAIPLT